MTNATLKRKINEYKRITEEFKRIETIKKELSATILKEFKNNSFEEFGGYRVIAFERETIKKDNIPPAIWDRFKTITPVEYLKPCK